MAYEGEFASLMKESGSHDDQGKVEEEISKKLPLGKAKLAHTISKVASINVSGFYP